MMKNSNKDIQKSQKILNKNIDKINKFDQFIKTE